MPPTSSPLKLFMEEIVKTPSLSGKCVKLQAYIEIMKEEKNAMKDLNYPIGKQCLDDAIKTLEVEHNKVLAQIKNILNQTGIIDVSVSPEEMIKVFQNLSLTPTNPVMQPAPVNATATNTFVQMQHGLGKHGSLKGSILQQVQRKLQQQQQRFLQVHQQQHQQNILPKQQGLGQHPF